MCSSAASSTKARNPKLFATLQLNPCRLPAECPGKRHRTISIARYQMAMLRAPPSTDPTSTLYRYTVFQAAEAKQNQAKQSGTKLATPLCGQLVTAHDYSATSADARNYEFVKHSALRGSAPVFSGVARISPREGPNLLAAKGIPYHKLKTLSDFAYYFLGVALIRQENNEKNIKYR